MARGFKERQDRMFTLERPDARAARAMSKPQTNATKPASTSVPCCLSDHTIRSGSRVYLNERPKPPAAKFYGALPYIRLARAVQSSGAFPDQQGNRAQRLRPARGNGNPPDPIARRYHRHGRARDNCDFQARL